MLETHGIQISRAITSQKVINNMINSDKFIARTGLVVGGTPSSPINLDYVLPGWDNEAARRTVEAATGVTFTAYDRVYRTRPIGGTTTTNNRFFPQNKIVFLPSQEQLVDLDDGAGIGFGKTLTSPHPEGNWQTGFYEWERETVDPWGVDRGHRHQGLPVLPLHAVHVHDGPDRLIWDGRKASCAEDAKDQAPEPLSVEDATEEVRGRQAGRRAVCGSGSDLQAVGLRGASGGRTRGSVEGRQGGRAAGTRHAGTRQGRTRLVASSTSMSRCPFEEWVAGSMVATRKQGVRGEDEKHVEAGVEGHRGGQESRRPVGFRPTRVRSNSLESTPSSDRWLGTERPRAPTGRGGGSA